MNNTTWQIAAQRYLARLAQIEYQIGIAAHNKAGRVSRTYRHSPSQYHRDLIELLGANDERGFKALKGEQGYASAIKV